MKVRSILWLATLVVSSSVPAFAQWGSPESVVPEGHWTYAALKKLRGQRDVEPTLDRYLLPASVLTRNDFADILHDRLKCFKHPMPRSRGPAGPPGPPGLPGASDKLQRQLRRDQLTGKTTMVSRIPDFQTLIAEFRNELWLRGEEADSWIGELEARRLRIRALPHSPARARMRDSRTFGPQ